MTPPPPNGRPETPPGQSVATIKVSATIQGEDITLRVSPWEVKVAPGTAVEWTVDGADSIEIKPKQANKWPFPGHPSKGRPNLPAKAGKVVANTPIGSSYSYSIVLSAGGREIDIDPIIVIRDPDD